MTRYVVFGRAGGDDHAWNILGDVVEAHSARQAIREAAALFVRRDAADGYQVFAAVPERSWKTVTVDRVVVEQIRLS